MFIQNRDLVLRLLTKLPMQEFEMWWVELALIAASRNYLLAMSSPGFFSAPSADWILCVYLDSIIYGLSNGLRWLALSQALAICSLELVMWRYGYRGADQNEQKFGFCPLVLLTCISSRGCQAPAAPPRGGRPDIVFGMRETMREMSPFFIFIQTWSVRLSTQRVMIVREISDTGYVSVET